MKGFKRLSTWKKFLISLLATTVSIVLTFGTTAIIDRKKQNAEKREMVLMVMYDMRESMEECEQCQKELKAFCDVQVDLVAHPEKFSGGFVQLMVHVPFLNYTTTTENIFKSNTKRSAPSAISSLSRPSPLSIPYGKNTRARWRNPFSVHQGRK